MEWITFLPKLVYMLLFSTKKLNFYFFNSPIFGYCRLVFAESEVEWAVSDSEYSYMWLGRQRYRFWVILVQPAVRRSAKAKKKVLRAFFFQTDAEICKRLSYIWFVQQGVASRKQGNPKIAVVKAKSRIHNLTASGDERETIAINRSPDGSVSRQQPFFTLIPVH